MRRMIHYLTILIFIVAVGHILTQYGYIQNSQYGMILGVLVLLCLLLKLWRRKRLLHSSFRKIDQMTGERFEEYLMAQFRRKGYRVRLTPVSGDFGADLIMRKWRRSYVVQAKRYSGSVGIKAVQEVIGAMQYYDIENGMVITNSYYTRAAKELAEASGIELWDRRDIEEEFHIP